MRTIAFLLAAVGLASTGCAIVPDETACTLLYAYGVTAEVTDATTGEFISDATLTLRDGNYEEEMQYRYQGSYVGAGERAGTYTLEAFLPGYESQTINNIVVTADECHVIGVAVTVKLVPDDTP